MFDDIYKDKLINAIIYFSKKVKYPTITKIFKLLNILDFYHFKQVGISVTNKKYYAWQFGPVPKDIWFDIKSGNFEKEFCSDICIMPYDEESEKQGYEIKAKRKPNLELFTPREKKIMEQIVYIYKNTTPTEISEISHLKNQPWYKTLKTKGEGKEIDYMLAIDDEALIDEKEAKLRLIENEEMLNNYLESIK